MARRMEKLVGVRIAEPAHIFLEQLANESDRCVSNMARRLIYERLSQIAAERQQQPGNFTETAGDPSIATAA